MRFCRRHNLAPQWAFTLLNPIILQQITNLIHYDVWFMLSIHWHFTTHRWVCYSVDCKFVTEYCTTHALFEETYPVLLYYTDESLSRRRIRHINNFDTFSQFFPILCIIICNNIIPGVCLPIDLWFKYRFTIMSIIKEPIVNITWIVKRDIPVLYLRSPYIFWRINPKDI